MTKMLDYYISRIAEELEDAKHYAQRYAEYKTSKNSFAKMYYEMSIEELQHAKYLKIMGQVAIEEAQESVTAQQMEAWTKAMNDYAENNAIIRMMLK